MTDIVDRLEALPDSEVGQYRDEVIGPAIEAIKAARAEVERLKRDHVGAHRIIMNTVRHLDADNERLRGERDEACKHIERLRAALSDIRDVVHERSEGVVMAAVSAHRIAVKALACGGRI